MMQQYLRWSWDFEVGYTFELMTQPSENCSRAENR